VAIDGRIARHHRVNVGNGDENRRRTAAHLRHRQLVEIARVVVVDRAPQKMAQVAPALSGVEGPAGCRRHCLRHLADLRVGRRRVVRLEAAFDHRATRDRFQRSAVIQHRR